MTLSNMAEFQPCHDELRGLRVLCALAALLRPDSIFQNISDYTREKAAVGVSLLSYRDDSPSSDVEKVEACVLTLIVAELHMLLAAADPTTLGSSARQLLLALQMLAISDENALSIVTEGVVQHLEVVISKFTNIATLRQAVACITRLSLPPATRQVILTKHESLVAKLRTTVFPRDTELHSLQQRALFCFDGFKHKPLANAGTAGHIMISYSWHKQPIALQIRDMLRKNGHNVWRACIFGFA
jgi:hypothetical protein